LITIEEVEHVAKLARLELDETEKSRLTKQLGDILDYFNQLKEVNTENVDPMTQPVPKTNVMREDNTSSVCNRDKIMANAPLEEDGYFKVPRIAEE
jgi:aspartyl-tRNA(Asn)/glutamyl-tRNA(Gln) amidotransferase subunit C